MKRIIPSILFLCMFSVGASVTFGQCSCAHKNISAHDEYKLADAVFVGKVSEIKKTLGDKDSRTEAVTFEVTKAWKLDLQANLTIYNTITFCVNGFEKNQEWIVYAYKNQDGTLHSFCCCPR